MRTNACYFILKKLKTTEQVERKKLEHVQEKKCIVVRQNGLEINKVHAFFVLTVHQNQNQIRIVYW